MTDTEIRPWNRLPLPMPSEHDPSEGNASYFYDNFVHHFIPDMLRMTTTGLNIDQEAVEELRTTIDKVLDSVTETLASSPIIAKYQKKRYPKLFAKYKEETLKSLRTVYDYIKPYNGKNIVHRTYVVNNYLCSNGLKKDTKDKWTIKELKDYNLWSQSSFIANIISNSVESNNSYVLSGMEQLAEDKLELWNRPRYDKVKQGITVPPFNPASSLNKKEFFEMVGSSVLARSKDTGEASWGRKEIEILLKETPDGDLKNVLQAFIDHSFSGIIKNNFLAAFDSYTIDGVLYGNIKLGGAKTWRNTSNSPNLLNAPSTGSIYAKPLKRCFVPPEGMLTIQADFSSLEDVILANLTNDPGKIAIQKDKTLDAHCYNALGYYGPEIEAIIGSEGSYEDKVRRFKISVEEKHKELKAIRQKSKPNTFKLAYLGFPDFDKGGTITQEIYDNYHDVLYPGVKDFLENYVMTTAREQGYLHLGLGARIYCDDIDDSFRTMFNSNFQFWSILTIIAVNELNYRIDEANLQDDIQITSTIYDSIYANITPDPQIVKWYNDNLVEIGKKDFMHNQIIPNTLECGIGRNWGEELAIPANASREDIEKILTELQTGENV